MRDKLLLKLAGWHANHPGRMAAVVVLLTVILGFFSTRLSVTMRWSDILPAGDRRTVEFNRIVEEFSSATSIIVVVQGEEHRMKSFADAVAPRILTAYDSTHQRRLVRRVDYKTEVDFLKKHGLMLIKEDDLENMKDVFTDPNTQGLLLNLNESMEKEYVGKGESISTREKEDQAVMFLDGIGGWIDGLQRAAQGDALPDSEIRSAADGILIGEPYLLSYDKTCLILDVIPNFTVTDLDILIPGTEAIQSIVDETLRDYPGLTAGLTGMIPISRDEMVYSEQSLGYTTLIAVVAILVLLVVSLRMWVAPLFAMANLLLGILWAVGLTALLVGQLNIMTQMMAVILLGLGIDYAIHLISGFTEWRAAGDTIHAALEKTFLKSGKGILTGALTTAFAFYAMIISSSRGMKEMGIVTATGLLAILLATFLILPIFLVLRERRIDRNREKKETTAVRRDISFAFLGKTGQWLARHHRLALSLSVLLTLFLLWSASRITFDQNYLNIEPKGLVSVSLQDTILSKFDMDLNYALILTDTPQESRELAEELRDMGSVAMTDNITTYLPSAEEQRERGVHVREIRRAMHSASVRPSVTGASLPSLRKEIERLEMNIMEMQDMAYIGGQDKVDAKCQEIVGDPADADAVSRLQILLDTIEENPDRTLRGFSRFQRTFAPYFKQSVIAMANTDPIRLEDLPESILNRYSNDARDQFLVTVYSAGPLWQDADYLHRFVDDLERITDRATGMPPVFRALIEIIGRDGRNAMMLTLVIVFLLLCVDFRNVKYALIAMIPLAVGAAWMVGLMKLTGQQFTVMNIMGLPMIIGIGIDDGVHIVHRWLHEGKGHIRTVFASTGKAILLTSLTTMLAFGSLIFSIWRGFGHLGGALFVGVAACFLTTVLILSGIMGWMEREKK